MESQDNSNLSRRGLLGAFAGIAMVSAAPVYSKTFGYVKGAGNIRRVRLRSSRTGESVDTIYWIDGQYIKPAMKEINYFMRDWRENSVAKMDPNLIDVIAATHFRLDTDEPFTLLSGYRTSRTNNMLRSRGSGVAKKSYHLKAQASDVRLKSRSVSSIARAAVAGRGGGVGKYHRSGFVHVDCGPIRTWG
ncbi:Tat pathway signal protein [Amylibacter kogurei]|uniref:Murein endopeptidase K n=1 Tax=Paramylibacter kogurei TaxID=1889778 RepID=A0A2G5K6Y7_9RHOB|nr:DUF882 domain-containing protein [Amylibacter kogurei]PIB24640.1 Tat pathway signal protein [Amylibacter kogurei]